MTPVLQGEPDHREVFLTESDRERFMWSGRLDHHTPTSCFRCGGAIDPLQRLPKRRAQRAKFTEPFLHLDKTCRNGCAHVLARRLAA